MIFDMTSIIIVTLHHGELHKRSKPLKALLVQCIMQFSKPLGILTHANFEEIVNLSADEVLSLYRLFFASFKVYLNCHEFNNIVGANGQDLGVRDLHLHLMEVVQIQDVEDMPKLDVILVALCYMRRLDLKMKNIDMNIKDIIAIRPLSDHKITELYI
ncbi:hypothetical protein ACJX0J_025342 [Zea mays]